MIRIINFALLAIMIAGAAVTYEMKHRAEQVAVKVARLNANVTKEKEAIAELKAEWSVLSQPGRLQAVIAKYQDHFRLEPFLASQVATFDEIPFATGGEEDLIGQAAVADATEALN